MPVAFDAFVALLCVLVIVRGLVVAFWDVRGKLEFKVVARSKDIDEVRLAVGTDTIMAAAGLCLLIGGYQKAFVLALGAALGIRCSVIVYSINRRKRRKP